MVMKCKQPKFSEGREEDFLYKVYLDKEMCVTEDDNKTISNLQHENHFIVKIF